MDELLITNTRAEHVPQLVDLQIVCYPTLADTSRLKAPHFESHLRIFPEGQWVALHGERVVGMSAGFLYTFDFDHKANIFTAPTSAFIQTIAAAASAVVCTMRARHWSGGLAGAVSSPAP
jgi:hypothetical protein